MSNADQYDVNWVNFRIVHQTHLKGRMGSKATMKIWESKESYIVEWDEDGYERNLSPIDKKWLLELKPEEKWGIIGKYMTDPSNELRKRIKTNIYNSYIPNIIHFFSKLNPNIKSSIQEIK